jgi:hypothetical protein
MTSPRLTEESMAEDCKANSVSTLSNENARRRDRISRASFIWAFQVAIRNARGVAVSSNKRPVGADCQHSCRSGIDMRRYRKATYRRGRPSDDITDTFAVTAGAGGGFMTGVFILI